MAPRPGNGAASGRLRTTSSFAVSAVIHGSLLAWLLLAAATQPAERRRTIYEQEIQPYEKHLIWYNLHDKLPDVKPPESSRDRQPPRARTKFNQSVVAGKKDDERPPQRIVMPAPAIELPKPLPLPNVVAVKEPSRLRPFVPPASPVAPPPTPLAPLPEAPPLDTAPKTKPLEIAPAGARPVKAFTPPVGQRTEPPPPTSVVIPEAPRLAISPQAITLPVDAPVAGPRRSFSVPSVPSGKSTPEPAGPAAPELAPSAPPAAGLPRIPRGFIAPPPRSPAPQGSSEPALEAPPLVNATATPGAAETLAIVGLSPTRTMEVPPPAGSHEAGFSGGEKPRPSTGEGAANDSASITIPGLSAHGGAKDSAPTMAALPPIAARQKLLAALHEAIPAASLPAPPIAARAAHVSSAPDPRLAGRYVYTLAIQMPNVTSYSGSWIVWFAEHQPERGDPATDLRAPVALRKVDPKYIQSAVDERVEGTVRLSAVIRKTGHVEAVELLQHLDARLDRSAEEALAKWEFEPAQRDGRPVDVDAVFEIPFRLAPKAKR